MLSDIDPQSSYIQSVLFIEKAHTLGLELPQSQLFLKKKNTGACVTIINPANPHSLKTLNTYQAIYVHW